MKTKITAAFLAAGALAIAGTSSADEEIKHWRYSKPVEIESRRMMAAVPIDPEVIAGAEPGLEDLRVADAGGRFVPYALRIEPRMTREKKLSTIPFGTESGESENSMTVKMAGDKPASFNRISLESKDANFFRKIDVDGSGDGVTWTSIRSGMVVYDFSGSSHYSYLEQWTGETYAAYGEAHYRIANLSFRVPLSQYRFVRVRVPHGKGKEPVELRSVTLAMSEESDGRESEHAGKIISQTPGNKPKTTEFTVDFGSRLYLHKIRLHVPKRNFYRTVQIAGSDDAEEWDSLGSGVLYSIDLEGSREQKLYLEFSETKRRYLRLTVLDGDNPPLEMRSVKGRGLERYAVFAPGKTAETHRLYYGNEAAKKPDYDVGPVVQKMKMSDLGTAKLGRQKETEGFVYLSGKPWTERHPQILWGALILMGAILILLATRVMKKIE